MSVKASAAAIKTAYLQSTKSSNNAPSIAPCCAHTNGPELDPQYVVPALFMSIRTVRCGEYASYKPVVLAGEEGKVCDYHSDIYPVHYEREDIFHYLGVPERS